MRRSALTPVRCADRELCVPRVPRSLHAHTFGAEVTDQSLAKSMAIYSSSATLEVLHHIYPRRHSRQPRQIALMQRAQPSSRSTTTAPPPVQALHSGRMAFLDAAVA